MVFTANDPIDDAIRIRDGHQFEIKLHYPLPRNGAYTLYDMECYFFVPASLGMNRTNYPKSKFYDDLQTYTRFKTPSISLPGILSLPDSPLLKLKESIANLQEGGEYALVDTFEYRLKLFCCILQSSLREFVAFIIETTDAEDRDQLIEQYLSTVGAINDAYRAMRQRVFQPNVPRQARGIYAFGDEYISLLMERNSYNILENIKLDTSPYQRPLLECIARELDYRKRRQYPSIPSESSDNEALIFRRNVIKKYMHNVLFLDSKTKHDGAMIEQGLLGIAAGVSMLFATIVMFLSQSIYGPLTLPVFTALVVGYMFKDRIKELLRVYLLRKVSGILFDHKTRIYSDLTHSIGHCRESVDFLDESKIPDHIMKIRDRSHLTEIESNWLSESVLHYRKRIKLSSQAISIAYRDIDMNGINDIMRFNVSELTRRMGNPRKDVFVLNGDSYHKVRGKRVYHLNMILRYGGENHIRYKRLRIVLNRRGIKRIETVSDDG